MTMMNLNTVTKPEKACIVNLDDPVERERPIWCLFNPNEYTFSKHNEWNSEKVKGKNLPQLEFVGGDSMTLKMQLFFDTYATGEDVRETTNRIWNLMNVNSNLTDMNTMKGRPPMVEFRWGSTWTFNAVITDISQKFTLFRHDGKPLRATLDVTFLQAKEEGKYPGQNPTTSGQAGHRKRIVHEGDTIDWIAHTEYGDSDMWRHIADVNNLDNPLNLKPGQVLSITPLP